MDFNEIWFVKVCIKTYPVNTVLVLIGLLT
jgi:hypothetical protein